MSRGQERTIMEMSLLAQAEPTFYLIRSRGQTRALTDVEAFCLIFNLRLDGFINVGKILFSLLYCPQKIIGENTVAFFSG